MTTILQEMDFVNDRIEFVGRKKTGKILDAGEARARGLRILKRNLLGFCRSQGIVPSDKAYEIAIRLGMVESRADAITWYDFATDRTIQGKDNFQKMRIEEARDANGYLGFKIDYQDIRGSGLGSD